MTLEQACNQIVEYSNNNGLDYLSGVERMVRQFGVLPKEQREALVIFMEETKVDA